MSFPEIKPDRDTDAWIAEHILGWKRKKIPADANGENEGEVLKPPEKVLEPPRGISSSYVYPPVGKIHLAFHVPHYTTDARDAAALCLNVGLEMIPTQEVFHPLKLCERAVRYWADKKGIDITVSNC